MTKRVIWNFHGSILFEIKTNELEFYSPRDTYSGKCIWRNSGFFQFGLIFFLMLLIHSVWSFKNNRKSSGVHINTGACVCISLWRQCCFTILLTTPCRPTDPKLIPFGLAWTVEIQCPDTSSSNKNGGVLQETVNRPHSPCLYQSRLQFIPRSLGNAILQCLNVNAIFD